MGIFDAFCRKRIAISINLVRLRVPGSRSLVRAHHKGGSRFAGCGLRAWPMGPAPPSPAPRRGRPPHPATALSVVRGPCECDGTILRYVGCQAVNVYHASSKSQPPASPAPVGGFSVPGGPTLSSRHDDGCETIVASMGLSLGRELGQGRRSYKEMRNLNCAFGVASKAKPLT
jgi:hypothetical protein